jgi:hypothetical protein
MTNTHTKVDMTKAMNRASTMNWYRKITSGIKGRVINQSKIPLGFSLNHIKGIPPNELILS